MTKPQLIIDLFLSNRYTVPKIIWISASKPSLSRLERMQCFCPVFVYIYLAQKSDAEQKPTMIGLVFMRRFRLLFGTVQTAWLPTLSFFSSLSSYCNFFSSLFLWLFRPFPDDGKVYKLSNSVYYLIVERSRLFLTVYSIGQVNAGSYFFLIVN